MASNERDLVERLLRQSILTLCRETISYQHSLEVDGIVCITPENENQQIVIKVHEQIQKTGSGPENSFIKYETPRSFAKSYDPLCTPESLCSSYSSKDNARESKFGDNKVDHKAIINGHSSIRESADVGQSTDHSSSQQNMPISSKARDKGKMCISSSNSSSFIQENLDESGLNRSVASSNTSLTMGNQLNTPNSLCDYSPNLMLNMSSNSYTPIPCKRCDIVLPDAHTFEKHNLAEHSVFTCNICYRTFTARNNLKRHIRLHTGYKPYTCNICSSSFTRKDDLKFHLLKHNYDKPYRCNQCGKGYMDRSCLANHMLNEHSCKLMHVCPQCGEGFNNTHMFMEHKKSHPELKEFQCRLCNFTGINSLMYQKHMLTHGHKKTYRCDPCDLSFEEPFNYTVHLKRHRIDPSFTSYICCFCDNKLPTYKQFIRHEHSHAQNKAHACQFCNKQFRYPSNLREHMVMHEPNADTDVSQQYWCTECNQGFVSEELLRCHIFEIHEVNTKKEPVDSKSGLSNLIANDVESSSSESFPSGQMEADTTHSSNKPATDDNNDIEMAETQEFGDAVSGTDAEEDSNLVINEENDENHAQSSQELFPRPLSNGDINIKQEYPDDYEDSTGSSATSDVVNLAGSVKNEENQKELSPSSPMSESKLNRKSSGTKPSCFERVVTPEIPFRKNVPFTCKGCGEVYNDFDGFESHSTVVHRRYVCEYCGKIFTSKPNRERHVRYHTGERPYRCDLCGQSFFRGDDLKYHRTTRHSDVRPFKCKICSLYFSWPKDLNRHLKTHSINEEKLIETNICKTI
ncbi:zinc finger protein 433-like [Octopus sinensis]|uniref:Zinc finger protein 433-like n=1 Tax=Octopus sinensis TaxID=2607531 RepID=A0A6P7T0S8_9MOLL|nr:zinc finger protein 433-like [Octopus sinensis]XP_029643972.1 zinc finger protein 433-like [Octopus sinensis]XP_036364066.1 zinc finger protein 433-like [Octopus sinensis]